jgi:Flp pilus assembly protein TadD
MITALLDLMSACLQDGNPAQMATLAKAILVSIPDDIVALHFLGLALYQMGRMEAARRVFSRACARPQRRRRTDKWSTTGEKAATTLMREASTPAAGLGQAWRQIAHALQDLGFRRQARRAYGASLAARGLVIQGGTTLVPVSGQSLRKPD